MIITDGIIEDFRATIDEIVRGSRNPLSIIIIGLGKGEFEEML